MLEDSPNEIVGLPCNYGVVSSLERDQSNCTDSTPQKEQNKNCGAAEPSSSVRRMQ